MAARVVLYTRRGCHLCADARPVVAAVCSEARVAWEEVDVDTDPATAETYSELVPAVTVDGVLRGFWRIDPGKLHANLM
jgi:glutaredoxin